MKDIVVVIIGLAFAAMGGVAILAPTRVTRQFNVLELSAAGRNEVRAVYGGFGLMVAGMLAVSLGAPALRPGVCLTVAASLIGMVGGRLFSAAVDRTIGLFPLICLAVETVGAALLFYAAWGQ